MEPLSTYAEQRFDGNRAFQLFTDRLVIRGSEILSSDFEQTVRLDSLCAEFDRIWFRSPSFMAGLKLAGGAFIAVSVLQSGFGMSVGSYLGGLAAVGIVTGLLLAIATRNKVEYVVFNAPASRLKKSCRGAKSKCLSVDSMEPVQCGDRGPQTGESPHCLSTWRSLVRTIRRRGQHAREELK